MPEFYEESRAITTSSMFAKLGLTDAAIGAVSERHTPALTDDLPLYATLTNRGVGATNFNHIRTYEG